MVREYLSVSDIDSAIAGDASALAAAFHWDNTCEGSSYWASVSLLGEIDDEVITKLTRIKRRGY